MTYSVKYKRDGMFFYRTIKNIKGDSTRMSEGLPVRIFILTDERLIEIPIPTTEFRFSKERHTVILQNMEKEAGQKLPVN